MQSEWGEKWIEGKLARELTLELDSINGETSPLRKEFDSGGLGSGGMRDRAI